ncbi:hypothetical protein ACIBCM_13275 [Streptomyces sp. NPDC051018]|uniref:hypothetical protein n=1 Tax=Streptomyces sp. NPDC051018 TaxID=3365639 RepID=UPI0037A5EF5E
MFEPYVLAHIDRLTGVRSDTRVKYRKLVLGSMSPWLEPYTVEGGEGSIVRGMVRDRLNDHKACRRRCRALPSDRQPAKPGARKRLPRLDTDDVEDGICPLEREEWAWVIPAAGSRRASGMWTPRPRIWE